LPQLLPLCRYRHNGNYPDVAVMPKFG
jgi:hypothetical protein